MIRISPHPDPSHWSSVDRDSIDLPDPLVYLPQNSKRHNLPRFLGNFINRIEESSHPNPNQAPLPRSRRREQQRLRKMREATGLAHGTAAVVETAATRVYAGLRAAAEGNLLNAALNPRSRTEAARGVEEVGKTNNDGDGKNKDLPMTPLHGARKAPAPQRAVSTVAAPRDNSGSEALTASAEKRPSMKERSQSVSGAFTSLSRSASALSASPSSSEWSICFRVSVSVYMPISVSVALTLLCVYVLSSSSFRLPLRQGPTPNLADERRLFFGRAVLRPGRSSARSTGFRRPGRSR